MKLWGHTQLGVQALFSCNKLRIFVLTAAITALTGGVGLSMPDGTIALDGVTLTTDQLSFEDQGNGAFVGSGSSVVSYGDESFSILVGSGGLVVEADGDGWSLVSFSGAIEADLTLHGVSLRVDPTEPLTFQYDSEDSEYQLFGDAQIAVGGATVEVSIGSAGSPGLVISGGSLERFGFAATSSEEWSFGDLTVTPAAGGLSIEYASDEELFTASGGASVLFDSQSISVTFDAGDGLVLESEADGSLDLVSIDAEVAADVTFDGVGFEILDSTPFVFKYGSAEDAYEFYGAANLTIGGQTFAAGLGSAATPGLELVDGSVVALNFSITSSDTITFDDIMVTPAVGGLTVLYSNSTDQFSISGGATVAFDASTLGVNLPDNGIVFEVSDGSLTLVSLDVDVTASFTLGGMDFTTGSGPGLTFVFNSDDSQYEFYGSANLTLGGDTFAVDFGDMADPGVEVVDGAIANLNLSLVSTNSLSFDGVTLTPDADGLAFTYSEVTGNYRIQGGATVAFDNESFDVLIEDPTTSGPGLVMDVNGDLISLSAQVTVDFTVYGATFTTDSANPLTFSYDSVALQFELFGDASIIYHNGSETEEIAVDLGTSTQPGLTVSGGDLTGFNFGISSDLTYDGVSIAIGSAASPFTFIYDSENEVFESFGSVDIRFDATGTVFDAVLGDATTPGLVLSSDENDNLTLEDLNATVSGSFTVNGLSFDATSLMFSYDAVLDQFEANGGVSVLIGNDQLGATLGFSGTAPDQSVIEYPGFLIQDGDLVDLNFIVTETIEIAGATIDTTDGGIGFTFTEGETGESFDAFGGLSLTIDGQSLQVDAGTSDLPGLNFVAEAGGAQPNSLTLTSMSVSVTGIFTLYGVDVTPVDLTLNYSTTAPEPFDSAADYFEIFGEITVGVDGESISAFLGTASLPGLVFIGGELEELNLGISESITLSDLTIATTGDFLGINYNEEAGTFDLFGGLSVSFDGQTLSLQAGDATNPGMRLVTDASNHFVLDYLSATVVSDFSLYGLDVSLGEQGITFVYNRNLELYEVYGDLDLTLDGQTLDATLGDQNNPGLEIENGTVEEINIGISSNFSIDDFVFSVPTNNPLTLQYTASDDTYKISGQAELTSLWQASVEMGTPETPGIEIVDNDWSVDDLTIEIDNINVGFAQMKEVKVAFSDGVQGEMVDVDLDVVIPEMDAEFDAEVLIENGGIYEILIDYMASGSSEGIEIGATGINIAKLSVTLQNLAEPANLSVTGEIGLEFGGQISLDGVTASLAYIEGDVVIDRNGFQMTDTVYFGAYNQGQGWQSLISQGGAFMNIDWTDDIFFLESNLYMPTNYGIAINDTFFISREYIVFTASAEVRVPTYIHLIGGDDLGEIGVDLLIDLNNSANSFAAGWITLDFWLFSEEAGLEYQFDGGGFSFIGSGTISSIESEVGGIEGASIFEAMVVDKDGSEELVIANMVEEYSEKVFTFQIPDGATTFMASFDWAFAGLDTPVDHVTIEVTAPMVSASGEVVVDTVTLHEMVQVDGGYAADSDSTNLESGEDLMIANANGVKVSSPGAFTAVDGSDLMPLSPGTGRAILRYPVAYDSGPNPIEFDAPSLSFYYSHDAPFIEIADAAIDSSNSTTVSGTTYLLSGTTLPIRLEYFTEQAYEEGTKIALYVDTNDGGYDGTPILRDLPYRSEGDGETVEDTVSWTIENVSGEPSDVFYLYAEIDNGGGHRAQRSAYFGPFNILPQVYGSVADSQRAEVYEGMRVFLDLNGDGEFQSEIDESTLTNSHGNYTFHGVAEGPIHVGLITPHGHRPNEASPTIVTEPYALGNPVEINFDVHLLDSISGYVFSDTDGDGIFDGDEVGIAGVTLYIDSNSNGQFDKGIDRDVLTGPDGLWRFHNIEVNQSYTIHVLAYPSQISNLDWNSLTIDTAVEDGLAEGIHSHFTDNNVGIYPGEVVSVSNRDYMLFLQSHFSAGAPIGSISRNADPDEDDRRNEVEFILNTNPVMADTIPASIVRVSTTGGSGEGDFLTLQFDQIAKRRYEVQVSSDMVTWTTVDTFRANQSGLAILEIEIPTGSDRQFARLNVRD